MRPIVLLYESIHPDGLAELEDRVQVRYACNWSEDSIIPTAGDVEGIIIRANGRISRRLMRQG
jgi:hypothetical protein